MQFSERLQNFPISFFAIILGMSGFTLAFQRYEKILNLPFHISGYLLWVTGVLFVLVSVLYLLKMVLFSDSFKKELNHPIRINFFPLIAKIFLVNAVIFLSLKFTISILHGLFRLLVL
jgi:tellurite resistance protein